MTYQQAIETGYRLLLSHQIPDARTDAWLLLSAACGIDRNFYYMHMQDGMDSTEEALYQCFLKRRTRRVPLQYITGEQEFMGLRFHVSPHVLIPRQDTEVLVAEALKRLRPNMNVLDMCTGSGCIIISIKKYRQDISATACDISGQALTVAKENAALNNVPVQFLEGDLFEPVEGAFDMIVSNPPYIPTCELAGLMPEVRDFEPRSALDGDADGIMFYKRIVEGAGKHLKPGGLLLFEIGYDQAAAVSGLMRQAGYQGIEVIKDLAGLDRVVAGALP
ncbi:MAG: peptide chain release factor N(5)-glutamine methyltransferase [Eubacterium sp.]|jgi:release factor glutamine methyltransferase|nr:peptide chain release factor N(5)-glutamine methyltransferase [Eubacterium sp.]NBI85754.1 peptide chain release factor N(5)-glutamine methyltransferase [Lachnospiraceae bacterium]